MKIHISNNHYLLEKNKFLLKELEASLIANKHGIFILARIKNYTDSINTDNLINIICNDLKDKFPEYIFKTINEKYFLVIVNNINKEDYEATVEDIQKAIENKKYINNITTLNTTIGVVIFPEDSNIAEEIFTTSYYALKSISSSENQNYIFFQQFDANKKNILKDKALAKKIESAFKNNNIFLVFQPIIDNLNNITIYNECTLRIEEDEGDLLSVDDYIAEAEKFGFIKFIDELVLNLVVHELKKYPDIKLSVNISSYCIDNLTWLKNVKELLKNKDMHNRLIIEINENIIHKEFKKSVQFIRNIKDFGCKVLIDNFGSGYTSFAQLKNLPVDIIKIEGFYTQDILNNYNSQFFVKSILEMQTLLNKQIIADFVKSEDIKHKLIEFGINLLQGDAISKPTRFPIWRQKQD